MSFLSIEELKELVEQPQGLCVSIYMPTVQLGSETQQNTLRFKNLIRQAEAELEKYGLRPTDAGQLLQPAIALDNDEFWQNQNAGLALFIAERFFRYYRVPINLIELVIVSDRFHLKPLIPLLSGDDRFYILTLGQRDVRLVEGNRYGITREIEIEGLPKHMDEALQYDETAKDEQRRQGGGAGRAALQGGGSYHGQGGERENVKEDLLQYFHLVDRALHDFFRNRRSPLVLAGVNYLLPIYHEANTYNFIVEEGIQHNTKQQTPQELHAEAWAIVEPQFETDQQKAIDYYHESIAAGKGSNNLDEVIQGAFYGRVEQLFVPVGVQRWGHFDPDSMELEMHNDAQPGDEDLLNAAAIQTIFHGGTVYAVEPEKVPDDAPVAAVFRY
ncbi:baeRF3 domain-containing protein [Phormidesmis sp. 146-33]